MGRRKKSVLVSGKQVLNGWEIRAGGRPARLPIAIVCVVAVIISLGIGLNGLNNAFGNAVTCAFGAGALLLLTLVSPPSPGFFTARALPVACVVAGTAWALLPNVMPWDVNLNLRPDLMLSETLGVVGVLCALLCGSRVGVRRADIGLTVDALIVLAVLFALAGILLRSFVGDLPYEIWQVRADARFTGTLGNANVAGAYCGMMAALTFSRLLSVRLDGPAGLQAAQIRLAHASAYLVALTVLLATCFLTGSRSAGAATLFVIGVIGIAKLRRRGRKRANNWILIAVGVIAVLMLAVGISDLFLDRLDAAAGGDRSNRPEMWAHYTQLFFASPWFGYGLGAFETLNAQFLSDPIFAQGLWRVNSAHNLVLQFLLDGGLVYFTMLTIAAILIARVLVKRGAALKWGQGSDGIVGALFIAIASAMVDIALDVPAMALLTAFIAGLLWAPDRNPSRDLVSEPPATDGKMSDRPRFAG